MKKLTLTLALVLMAFFASAQIYELETSTFSVSRNSSQKNIIYSQKNDTTGQFVFLDAILNGDFEQQRTLKKFQVKDFCYIGDTIYVTGNYTDGTGFYGWAKTTGLLSQRWLFNMHLLENYVLFNLHGGVTDTIRRAHFENMRRIKVFYDGATRHILLIGDYKYNLLNNNTTHPGCLIDVWSENDSINYAYSEVENIDDVEVLDNYVVTVSRKGYVDTNLEEHYLRVLNKTGFSLNDNLFDTYYYKNLLASVGPIRLQKITGNNYVAAYKSDYTGEYSILPLSISSGAIQTSSRYVVSAGMSPIVTDVAYSPTPNKLMVIHNNGSNHVAAEYNCSNFPILTLSQAYGPSDGNNNAVTMFLQSVAMRPQSDFCISGERNGKLTIWWTGVCSLPETLTMESVGQSLLSSVGATTRQKMNQLSISCPNLIPGFISHPFICDDQHMMFSTESDSNDKEEN